MVGGRLGNGTLGVKQVLCGGQDERLGVETLESGSRMTQIFRSSEKRFVWAGDKLGCHPVEVVD